MRLRHLTLGIAAALVTMAMAGTAAGDEGHASPAANVGATEAPTSSASGAATPEYRSVDSVLADRSGSSASGAATPEYRSPDSVLADRGGVHPDVVGHKASDYSSVNALAGASGTDTTLDASPVAAANSGGVDFSDVAFGAIGGFVLAALGFWGITAVISRGRRRRLHGAVGA